MPVSWEEELAGTQRCNSWMMPGPLSHFAGGSSPRVASLTHARAFPLLSSVFQGRRERGSPDAALSGVVKGAVSFPLLYFPFFSGGLFWIFPVLGCLLCVAVV